ncbi:MAG: hypothetical protein JSW41_04990 [Candidatus Aenigmatarchaeota archaeon]|nr:MAG: hypothetical protein JSW41_04990 [Candidatus Aenigmarchaeota archaeon]
MGNIVYLMRKIIALLPVLLIIIVSGCTSQDPAQILKDSITKLNNLNSYQIDFDYYLSMSPIVEMEGEVTTYSKGDNIRVDMDMPFMMGMKIIIKTYYLPDGTFTCTEFMENVTCIRGGEGMPLLQQESSIEAMERLIEKEVIELEFLGMGNVADRNCYNISSDLDLSKLHRLTEEELGLFGINESMIGESESIKSFDIEGCYDSATGIQLHNKMIITVDMSNVTSAYMFGLDEIVMEIGVTATSYKPNEAIADSVFELPVEVTDIPNMEFF